MRRKVLALSSLVCILGSGALLSPASASAQNDELPCDLFLDGPCYRENTIILCDAGGYVHGLICTNETWTWM